MKVLLISTSERTGGGAIAANRLLHALLANGVEARMLVRDRQTSDPAVSAVGSLWPKVKERLRLMWLLRTSLKHTWGYDLMSDGIDIFSTHEYQEADIVHLHWVNQGMLSAEQVKRMVSSGKKVFWTLHDEWPYMGFGHYHSDALRHRTLSQARRMTIQQQLSSRQIHFIGCSEWITRRAREAMPLSQVTHINNCIPTSLFHPIAMLEARRALDLDENENIVLFCAQNVNDERKGLRYLEEALRQLPSVTPLIIGRGGLSLPPDKMPLAYAAADVFVTPSLEDNLPNTVAESLSCGTPCVAFRVGGIPEMIAHLETGYLAEPRNAADLARGISHVLSHPECRTAAARSALTLFSPEKIAQEHLSLYLKDLS